MRLFEVLRPLLESQAKIEKLAEKYGDKLDQAMRMDYTVEHLPWPAMSADFEDWVIGEFIDEESWDGDWSFNINADYFDKKGYFEALVEFFADNFDPTPNNKYLDWVLRMYIDVHSSQFQFFIEDGELVQDVLATFHQFKRHLPVKDINQYKSFTELKKAIKPFESEISDVLKREAIGTGEAEVIFEAGEERLIHVKTLKASKAFGRGTEWCTQYPNMFNQYNDQGPIYIIDTSNPDDRIQVHFESEQVKDKYDRSVNPRNVLKMHPTYVSLIDKRKREAEAVASGLTDFDDIHSYIHKTFEFGASLDWITRVYTNRLNPKSFVKYFYQLLGEMESTFYSVRHRGEKPLTKIELGLFKADMLERFQEIRNSETT